MKIDAYLYLPNVEEQNLSLKLTEEKIKDLTVGELRDNILCYFLSQREEIDVDGFQIKIMNASGEEIISNETTVNDCFKEQANNEDSNEVIVHVLSLPHSIMKENFNYSGLNSYPFFDASNIDTSINKSSDLDQEIMELIGESIMNEYENERGITLTEEDKNLFSECTYECIQKNYFHQQFSSR